MAIVIVTAGQLVGSDVQTEPLEMQHSNNHNIYLGVMRLTIVPRRVVVDELRGWMVKSLTESCLIEQHERMNGGFVDCSWKCYCRCVNNQEIAPLTECKENIIFMNTVKHNQCCKCIGICMRYTGMQILFMILNHFFLTRLKFPKN